MEGFSHFFFICLYFIGVGGDENLKINLVWPNHEARVNFCPNLFKMTFHLTKGAATRQNLSSGFPTKQDSNQSPQLHILARKLEFHL